MARLETTNGVQGEGDYAAARKFQAAQRAFVNSGAVEGKAREAAEGHCQSKFYTGILRPPVAEATVEFAHLLCMPRSEFRTQKGLYSFALTVPTAGISHTSSPRDGSPRASC